jgi:hypothetical protein
MAAPTEAAQGKIPEAKIKPETTDSGKLKPERQRVISRLKGFLTGNKPREGIVETSNGLGYKTNEDKVSILSDSSTLSDEPLKTEVTPAQPQTEAQTPVVQPVIETQTPVVQPVIEAQTPAPTTVEVTPATGPEVAQTPAPTTVEVTPPTGPEVAQTPAPTTEGTQAQPQTEAQTPVVQPVIEAQTGAEETPVPLTREEQDEMLKKVREEVTATFTTALAEVIRSNQENRGNIPTLPDTINKLSTPIKEFAQNNPNLLQSSLKQQHDRLKKLEILENYGNMNNGNQANLQKINDGWQDKNKRNKDFNALLTKSKLEFVKGAAASLGIDTNSTNFIQDIQKNTELLNAIHKDMATQLISEKLTQGKLSAKEALQITKSKEGSEIMKEAIEQSEEARALMEKLEQGGFLKEGLREGMKKFGLVMLYLLLTLGLGSVKIVSAGIEAGGKATDDSLNKLFN